MIKDRHYYTTVDGGEQEYEVKLRKESDDCYIVNIDGVEHVVDFAQTGDSYYSLIIDNKSYDVDVNEKGDTFTVLKDGDEFKVEVLDEMKRLMKLRTSTSLEGRQVVEAQMPGYIWKILVEPGQEVEAGQPLMILVAMKMENEIKAPKAGVVEEISVVLDQTIAIGDKLAIVE